MRGDRAPVLEDFDGGRGGAAGGQHRIQDQAQVDGGRVGQLVVVLDRPQRALVAEQAQVPHLGSPSPGSTRPGRTSRCGTGSWRDGYAGPTSPAGRASRPPAARRPRPSLRRRTGEPTGQRGHPRAQRGCGDRPAADGPAVGVRPRAVGGRGGLQRLHRRHRGDRPPPRRHRGRGRAGLEDRGAERRGRGGDRLPPLLRRRRCGGQRRGDPPSGADVGRAGSGVRRPAVHCRHQSTPVAGAWLLRGLATQPAPAGGVRRLGLLRLLPAGAGAVRPVARHHRRRPVREEPFPPRRAAGGPDRADGAAGAVDPARPLPAPGADLRRQPGVGRPPRLRRPARCRRASVPVVEGGVRDPRLVPGGVVYAVLNGLARRAARQRLRGRGAVDWGRDDTTRSQPAGA